MIENANLLRSKYKRLFVECVILRSRWSHFCPLWISIELPCIVQTSILPRLFFRSFRVIFPCFVYEREQRVLRKNVTFQRRGNMWFESFGKTIVLFCTTYDRWLYWKLRNLLKYDSFIRHVAIVIKSSSFLESISNVIIFLSIGISLL